MQLRRLRAEHPVAFERLLDAFTDILIEYVEYQEDAGADVLQLFDTYAGLLSPADYREFIVPRHRRILNAIDIPTIIFARNMSGNLDLLADSGADVVGLDWTVDIATARDELGETPVQGNLDPALLYGEPREVKQRARQIIEAAGDSGHILNLGHGVDRNTPVENVAAFFEAAHEFA